MPINIPYLKNPKLRSGAMSVALSLLTTTASAFEYCERLNTPSFFEHFTEVTGLTDDCEGPGHCAAARWEDKDSLAILIYTGQRGSDWGADMRGVVDQFAASFTQASGIPVTVNEHSDPHSQENFDIDIYFVYADSPILDRFDAFGLTERLKVPVHRTALASLGNDGGCTSAIDFDGTSMERALTVVSANQSPHSNRSCVVQALLAGSGFGLHSASAAFLEHAFPTFELLDNFVFPINYQYSAEVLHALPQTALNSRAELVAFRQSECGVE